MNTDSIKQPQGYSFKVMARLFASQLQPVLVEYTFHNVASENLAELPQQVESAVELLVRRERLPSEENVRDVVQENSGDRESTQEEGSTAHVQILLPHQVAMEVAMDRSFRTEQPPTTTPLSTIDVRILTRRSVRTRLRTLRERLRREDVLPKEHESCVVCMEDIRHNSNRMTLECEHTFHRSCIVEWLSRLRQCPTCRFEIDFTPRVDEALIVQSASTRSQTQLEESDDDVEAVHIF